MQSSEAAILPIIGTSMGGGFYAGRIKVGEEVFALIVAPKAEGQHKPAKWNKSDKSVDGALSYFDGMANTKAMAEAGSALAKWAMGLEIGGEKDWYIPSQDELEICYRALKPTERENWCYARSGINLSAYPPTYPYTPALPARTLAEAFQSGGAEAFDADWYWSSTRHASYSVCAWMQGFNYGYQYSFHKSSEYRARAVRRLKI